MSIYTANKVCLFVNITLGFNKHLRLLCMKIYQSINHMALQKTWRWFGESDSITLSELNQIGIEGIVASLSHFKPGEVWSIDDIMKMKDTIEKEGLHWSVVESLPVSEDIKLNNQNCKKHIDNYKTSLRNLAKCGLDTVCYNFMPVLDWARTDLKYIDKDGTETMLFDWITFAAFDIYILKRPDAEKSYSEEIVEKAKAIYSKMSAAEKEELAYNVIIYTQSFINSGIEDSGDYKENFLRQLSTYDKIDTHVLRNNLRHFLSEIIPVCEEVGIRMAIHVDDPPFPLLGLPRIASSMEDFEWIFSQFPSLYNGFTFCIGSLAPRKENDIPLFIEKFADRIHFIHLRNIQFLNKTTFYESGHLNGSVDLFTVVKLLLEEQQRRVKEGRNDFRMPFRPDHGKKMLDDFSRKSNPGYPLIGRMKGVAEISGLEYAIERLIN